MYKTANESADSPAELESQFILRLPAFAAQTIRDALKSNSTLKDRLNIRIDNDMRNGDVRVDNWVFGARIMDLPTIIESLKTIDSKSFYKTADICQMLVCREEDDQLIDDDSPQKTKRKDSNKVEKKYLMPHGVTPPTKNIRKRRFRKTLRKKYVEAPEIEKEVKRLLRIDNDAVSVKWEVINEDDENKVNKGVVIKKEPIEDTAQNVAEHDIFGGAVSDSEEEDGTINVLEMEENSADDSRLTDSNSMTLQSNDTKLLTEFTSDMFKDIQTSNTVQDIEYYSESVNSMTYSTQDLSKSNIESRLEQLQTELNDLKTRRTQQELEIERIENIALRQRFQNILDHLLQEQVEKEQEKFKLQELLKRRNNN